MKVRLDIDLQTNLFAKKLQRRMVEVLTVFQVLLRIWWSGVLTSRTKWPLWGLKLKFKLSCWELNAHTQESVARSKNVTMSKKDDSKVRPIHSSDRTTLFPSVLATHSFLPSLFNFYATFSSTKMILSAVNNKPHNINKKLYYIVGCQTFFPFAHHEKDRQFILFFSIIKHERYNSRIQRYQRR